MAYLKNKSELETAVQTRLLTVAGQIWHEQHSLAVARGISIAFGGK